MAAEAIGLVGVDPCHRGTENTQWRKMPIFSLSNQPGVGRCRAKPSRLVAPAGAAAAMATAIAQRVFIGQALSERFLDDDRSIRPPQAGCHFFRARPLLLTLLAQSSYTAPSLWIAPKAFAGVQTSLHQRFTEKPTWSARPPGRQAAACRGPSFLGPGLLTLSFGLLSAAVLPAIRRRPPRPNRARSRPS